MRKLILDDYKRVLRGYKFWAAVLVVLTSIVINLLTSVSYDHTKSVGAINLFLYGNLRNNLISLTVPFLATFIFSTSINDDMKTGLYNEYVSKLCLKKYIAGRAVSTAMIAGSAFIFAFLLILIGCYIYDPSYGGDIFNPVGMFSKVYSNSVGFYIMLFVLHSSLVVSIYALFGMGLATLTRNNFIVLALPGIIYHCAKYVSAILDKTIFAFTTVAFPFLTYETASIGMPVWRNMLQMGVILCAAIVLMIVGQRKLRNMDLEDTTPIAIEVSNEM